MICEQGTIWTFGKNSCGRLGVVDATCDDADDIIEDAIVLNEGGDVEGDESGEDENGRGGGEHNEHNESATAAIAYPLPIPVDAGNNEVDNFNEVIREMVAEAAILPSPTCIGKILDESEVRAGGQRKVHEPRTPPHTRCFHRRADGNNGGGTNRGGLRGRAHNRIHEEGGED